MHMFNIICSLLLICGIPAPIQQICKSFGSKDKSTTTLNFEITLTRSSSNGTVSISMIVSFYSVSRLQLHHLFPFSLGDINH